MTLENKKKLKPKSFKKMFSNEGQTIEKIDNVTYYVKGSMKEPYMVFYSNNNEKWYCDCLSFVYNITDSTTKDCKHILSVKALSSPTL